MSPFDFECAGERLQALPAGALHWPARRLLAVADLHLEKGSSYAVSARKLLPRHDTRQTLAVLAALIEVLQPDTVVCLGDSFHDREAVERLPEAERTRDRAPDRAGRASCGSRATMIPRRRRRAGAKSPKRSAKARWFSATRRASARPTAKSRAISIPWRR